MIFEVRPEERRAAGLAFATLFGVTASHTAIETARDALFLQKIPATHLPLMYVAIALAGLLTTRAGAALEARKKKRSRDELTWNVGGAALLTAAFWAASAAASPLFFYVLYI